ncbi:hypothetical protein TRVL_03661 [Trypanosoma vivax]|nr:hypothetical protein TRVL_03661 [Trypanosoma vivax]
MRFCVKMMHVNVPQSPLTKTHCMVTETGLRVSLRLLFSVSIFTTIQSLVFHLSAFVLVERLIPSTAAVAATCGIPIAPETQCHSHKFGRSSSRRVQLFVVFVHVFQSPSLRYRFYCALLR